MAYSTYAEQSKAIKDLLSGKSISIPCTNCIVGKISARTDTPITNQNTFYCNNCGQKIIVK